VARRTVGSHHSWEFRIPITLMFRNHFREHTVQRFVEMFTDSIGGRLVWAGPYLVNVKPFTKLLK